MSQLESSFQNPQLQSQEPAAVSETPMLEADHAKRVASWIMPNGLKVMFDAVPYELCAKIETELNLTRTRLLNLQATPQTTIKPDAAFIRVAADLDTLRKEHYLLKQDHDHAQIACDEQSKTNTELKERVVQLATDAQLVRQENAQLKQAIVRLVIDYTT